MGFRRVNQPFAYLHHIPTPWSPYRTPPESCSSPSAAELPWPSYWLSLTRAYSHADVRNQASINEDLLNLSKDIR